MVNIKKSYGIICCRKHPSYGTQLILVKKPYTYHFCEFITGRYRKHDDYKLIKLFNNMTYYEKMDILSLKFEYMWYRVFRSNPEQTFKRDDKGFKNYIKKKTKFEVCFLHDGGQRLKKLMATTNNVETLWEIPKGRKNENDKEDQINTAIREFTEETAIEPSKYTVLWRINPYIDTYSDFGVTYQNIYYFAVANGDWDPCIKFSNGQQIHEIAAIRWCNLIDINLMKLDPSTHKRLIKLFKKISTKYKNYFKQ